MSEHSAPDIDKALVAAANRIGASLIGERRYGWNRKSVGSRIFTPNGKENWLRIQFAINGKLNDRLWNGEVAASAIVGVSKPSVESYFDWEDSGVRWRATIMSMITQRPCSPTPELRVAPCVDLDWFGDLRRSIDTLNAQLTDRVNCRHDLIRRRITERFGGGIDPTVSSWVVCHGDLHWANITCPRFVLLDWEGWGLGPRGLDAAFLLAFSSLCPEVHRQVAMTFVDVLNERDGLLSILFACSELIRMSELYGDHPDLKPLLVGLAQDTLRVLRT